MRPVDARTADDLLAIAEDARERTRREDPTGAALIEARYPELLEALDWYLDAGQPDQAFRLATALVPFWMSTKRIDDGDRWFERALAQPAGSAARRARATYDHGYLVFWAGRYDLADERFADARARPRRSAIRTSSRSPWPAPRASPSAGTRRKRRACVERRSRPPKPRRPPTVARAPSTSSASRSRWRATSKAPATS